jgi:hypothetical protein
MMECVAVDQLDRFADHPAVVARLAGLPSVERARALGETRFTLLRDGDEVAIFEMSTCFGEYHAVLLDIDNPTDFTWRALDHIFGDPSVKRVLLESADAHAGTPFRAWDAGLTLKANHGTLHRWQLERGEFARAMKDRALLQQAAENRQ